MYSLIYDMLVPVLRQFHYSGEVNADISPRSKMQEGGQITLIVQKGEVRSCVILNKSGQKVYHDQEAYHLVSRLGVLDWKLVPSSSPPSLPIRLCAL